MTLKVKDLGYSVFGSPMRETDLGFKSNTGKDIKVNTNYDITDKMAGDMQTRYKQYEDNLAKEEASRQFSMADRAENRRELRSNPLTDAVNRAADAVAGTSAQTPVQTTPTTPTAPNQNIATLISEYLKRLKELNTQTGASGGVTTLPFDLSNIPSYFNGVYKPTDNNDLVKYVTDIWTNRYSPVNY